MPLKSGRSKATVSRNVGEMMHSYKRTGKIGNSRPASKKKASKQAAAIALKKAGKATRLKSQRKSPARARTRSTSRTSGGKTAKR